MIPEEAVNTHVHCSLLLLSKRCHFSVCHSRGCHFGGVRTFLKQTERRANEVIVDTERRKKGKNIVQILVLKMLDVRHVHFFIK